MPIRGKREFICQRCGRRFTVETGDVITIKNLKNIRYCIKCRIIAIFSFNKVGDKL